MRTSALEQLIVLQKSMYERARMEATDAAGTHSPLMLKYQSEFERSLPEQFSVVQMRRILEAIDRNQVTLFGDFHSHKQNQRAFLRVLRTYLNRPDHGPVTVALEMFRSKDQVFIDKWLEGRCTDHELLDAVEYDVHWGFPWNNYRPILEFCRANNIAVLGVNTDHAGKDSIEKRDHHTATLLSHVINPRPDLRVLCLIGEFHLADNRLPKSLSDMLHESESNTVNRVFANLDKYFFSTKPDRLHRQDEFLELDQEMFCIMNSAPWIKWQSHALWEEMRLVGSTKYLQESIAPDDEFFDDEDESTDYVDVEYHLRRLQKQVADFFKISTSSEILDRFQVVSIEDVSLMENLEETHTIQMVQGAVRDGYAIDYAKKMVYVHEVSINNLAASAGQMLFGTLGQLQDLQMNMDQRSAAHVLKYTFGFMATKILNPRFPLHSYSQIETHYLMLKRRRLHGPARLRREVLRDTLALFEWIQKYWFSPRKNYRKLPKQLIETDFRSLHEVSKNVGQLLAGAIYLGLMKERIDIIDVKRWFHSAVQGGNPQNLLSKICATVAG